MFAMRRVTRSDIRLRVARGVTLFGILSYTLILTLVLTAALQPTGPAATTIRH